MGSHYAAPAYAVAATLHAVPPNECLGPREATPAGEDRQGRIP
jgi:hypothetical protein